MRLKRFLVWFVILVTAVLIFPFTIYADDSVVGLEFGEEYFASTQTINWNDEAAIERVDLWIKEAGAVTVEEKARAIFEKVTQSSAYNTSQASPNTEYIFRGKVVLAKDIPAYYDAYYHKRDAFLDAMEGVMAYQDGVGGKYLGICEEFSWLYAGCLRSVGIPAYCKIVNDGAHQLVVYVDLETGVAWESDPTLALNSGSAILRYRAFHLRNVSVQDLIEKTDWAPERAPLRSRRNFPEWLDMTSEEFFISKDYPKKENIFIQLKDRYTKGYEGSTYWIKGRQVTGVMSWIKYDGKSYYELDDVCKLLADTPYYFSPEWSDARGTVVIVKEEYGPGAFGYECQNVLRPDIGGQAVMLPNVWAGDEYTDCGCIMLEGTCYVDLHSVPFQLGL